MTELDLPVSAWLKRWLASIDIEGAVRQNPHFDSFNQNGARVNHLKWRKSS
jgi:hypothetical protein